MRQPYILPKMKDKVISIVMITVPERQDTFQRLHQKVQSQIDYCFKVHPTLGNVEIVEVSGERTDKGGKSIGEKRQEGLNKATGKYVCWLDDDDNISPDYVETLLRLAEKNTDVLSFNTFAVFDKSNPGLLKVAVLEPVAVYGGSFSTLKKEYELYDTLNELTEAALNMGIIDQALDRYDPGKTLFLRTAHSYQSFETRP